MVRYQECKKFLRQITLPLRPTLVAVVVIIIIFTSVGVGYFSYNSAWQSINQLWRNLSQTLADTTTDKSLDYLRSAPPFLKFTSNLTEHEEIDVDNVFAIMDYCKDSLNAFPNFYLVYFAKLDGSVVGALRTKDYIQGIWYVMDPFPVDPKNPTRERSYKLDQMRLWGCRCRWGDDDPRSALFGSLLLSIQMAVGLSLIFLRS